MNKSLLLTVTFLIVIFLIPLQKAEQDTQAEELSTLIDETDIAVSTTWAKTYGGIDSEYAREVQLTTDGGYLVIGFSNSFPANGRNIWLLKVNSVGEIEWQKTYGNSGYNVGTSVQQTSDGGYIVVGYDDDSDKILILKLSFDGVVEWGKTYIDSSYYFANDIKQTTDGGYIVVGARDDNLWVLKLAFDGSIEWQKAYDGSSTDHIAHAVQQTADGGYIVAGQKGLADEQFWILKLSANGGIEWQKTYGGPSFDIASSIQQTLEGGYIVTGQTWFTQYNDSCNVWILKLNSIGNIEWQKAYGGIDCDVSGSIQQTTDGGYVVAGATDSFGEGGSDAWILRLDPDGGIIWQKNYGDDGSARAASIKQTVDGGFIVAGRYSSATDFNLLLLKLDADGRIPDCNWMNDSDAIITITNREISEAPVITSSTNVSSTTPTIIMRDSSATTTKVCPLSQLSCLESYYLSQRDTRWAEHDLRGCPQFCSYIWECGCALTSATMVFNYYGADLTPDALSDCMWDEACPFNWYWEETSESCSQGTANFVRNYDFSYADLEHELNQNDVPVILRMHKQSDPISTHFVVVVSGQGTNPHDYMILDPWPYEGAYERLDALTNLGYVPDSIRVYEGEPDCSNAGNTVYETASIQPVAVLFSETPQPDSPSIGKSSLDAAPSIIASNIITGQVGVYHLTSITMTIGLTATSQLGAVTEMQVWTEVNPNPTWQPFAGFAYLPVDEAVYAKFRDVDGNISTTVMDSSIPIHSPPPYFFLANLPIVLKSN